MLLSSSFLLSLKFKTSDIPYILDCDHAFGSLISPISDEYMETNLRFECDLLERRAQASEYLKKVQNVLPDFENPYILQLLFWLYCVPHARKRYAELGIGEDIFYDTMADLACKNQECKDVKGKIGVFVEWFFLFFDYSCFALGRLQFQISVFDHALYRYGDYELHSGDRIYSCHIPSGNSLSEEACMDSFHRAYLFWKDELKADIIPVYLQSWMIFPNYIDKVFPADSNLMRFSRLFEIIDVHDSGRRFSDCWRFFGKDFCGTTEGYPQNNSLQRNFVKYIDNGGTFGSGIGILLYDGKQRKIINKKYL